MSDINITIQGCTWPGNDPQMCQYHDEEWGIPLLDDWKLFEFLVLDAFQAGLSWKTILHKRSNFRNAFDHFDATTIAHYSEAKVQSLLLDAGIIRNKLKIKATVENAKCFLAVQKEWGSFAEYIWQFVQYRPINHHYKITGDIPVSTAESLAMSKDLQKRGFKFVGTTICYAFMQASGMVNDHLVSCPRHSHISSLHSDWQQPFKSIR